MTMTEAMKLINLRYLNGTRAYGIARDVSRDYSWDVHPSAVYRFLQDHDKQPMEAGDLRRVASVRSV